MRNTLKILHGLKSTLKARNLNITLATARVTRSLKNTLTNQYSTTNVHLYVYTSTNNTIYVYQYRTTNAIYIYASVLNNTLTIVVLYILYKTVLQLPAKYNYRYGVAIQYYKCILVAYRYGTVL